ncbi:HNH endonuclease signature motif containing protein [Thauera butanivorans]|uniref:HNH endonuclease signature motif containing protein n=1 Tax=Thauera butanivorans TaxID=86174 RepID=UPI000838CBA2|nr:HNH endonuclease signature motif containing protein [Thauera butanivorans]
MSASRPWSAADDDALRRLYTELSASAVARHLGRTRSAVRNRITALGLRKSTNSGQFRAGHTTWNKGMQGLDIGGKATRFKKGNRPHTWHPIGHTRVTKDGYLQRKTADTGVTRRDYVHIHHLVWRMHGGTVPPGHALVFRDGDRLNLDINNLELITRAELMRRNTVHRLPPDLKQVADLKRQLSRKLTYIERSSHEQ